MMEAVARSMPAALVHLPGADIRQLANWSAALSFCPN